MLRAGTTISCRFSARILGLFLTAGSITLTAQQPVAPLPPPVQAVPPLPAPPQGEPPAVTPLAALPGQPVPPPSAPIPPGLQFPSAPGWSIPIAGSPAASPTTDRVRAFVAFKDGSVKAYRLADGAEIWSAALASDRVVAADGERVLVVAGETVHALKAADGASMWTVTVGKLTAPVLLRGGWAILATPDGLMAIRAADGSVVWTRQFGAVTERPAVDGDALYVPIAEGRLTAVALETGKDVWSRVIGPSPTEPLAFGDRIYVGSDGKRFYCLRASSGLVDWSWQIGTRTIGAAGVDADHVYVVAMDNQLRALDRVNGAQRWKYPLAFRPTSGPVVLGPFVTVPGLAIELPGVSGKTGKLSGKAAFPTLMSLPPGFAPSNDQMEPPGIVSVTGGMTKQWMLTLWLPPGSVRKP